MSFKALIVKYITKEGVKLSKCALTICILPRRLNINKVDNWLNLPIEECISVENESNVSHPPDLEKIIRISVTNDTF